MTNSDLRSCAATTGPDDGAPLLTAMIAQVMRPVSATERRAAVTAIGDTLGVMLAGAGDPRCAALMRTMTVQAAPATGLSRIAGANGFAPPPDAALLMGFAAHLLDFDDDETEVAMAHLSAPCLPAALAIAGRAGLTPSGADLIDAYVTGCQVMLAVGSFVNPVLYKSGWHATSVLGVFGAAAAAARLLGLDAATCRHTFGLAASLASGPRGAFGGEGKPLQVGQASASGVRAALLAQAGWTAAPGALAGERGVLTRMAGGLQPGRCDIGDFPPEGFVTKPYPSCTATHAAVAETLALVAEMPGDICKIRCDVDPFVPGILIAHLPTSPDEGRFSLPYCLAAAAIHGALTPEAFTAGAFGPAGPRDAAVAGLMARVEIGAARDLPKGPSGISTGAVIEIEWHDGTRRSGRRDAGPGSRIAPLSQDAQFAKFALCLGTITGAADIRALWETILRLATLPSAGPLFEAIPAAFHLQGQNR